MYIYDKTSQNYYQNEKFFIQKMYRKSKHILYSVNLFPEIRAVYAIMWKVWYKQTGYR